MSLARKEIFEFGEFRLDASEHTIERIDGTKNGTLPEKAFQALVLLVRRRGHLVSKDELIRFIWPDTIVEDNNLEKCIHHLRHFLGEGPDKRGYIETVRKHGYRFIGNVQTTEVSGSWIPETFRFANVEKASPALTLDQVIKPEAIVETRWHSLAGVHIPARESEDVNKTESKESEKSRYPLRSGTLRLALMVVLIGGLAGLGYYLFRRSALVTDGRRSIAVLPFKPVDGADRNSAFEFGVADSLIQSLSNGLVVQPLSSTRKYAETDQDPRSAGRELGVDYVVASNYENVDDRIKVTSQFLEVASGKVEAFAMETDSGSLIFAQEEIANDISKKLIAKFASGVVEFAAKGGTTNQEAHALYVLAMNSSEERGIQQVLKSLEYLDRAVALDPNYAIAWAAKAITHGDIVGHTNAGQHEHFQSSLEALTKALAIDPNLSEAYSASCQRKNRYEYDFTGAETDCKHAVELDPNSSVAHRTYANFLYSRGRSDEAIVEIKNAIDLRPVSFRNQQMLGLTLYFAGRYDEAEEQFKRLVELNPNHNFLRGRLVKVYEQKGNYLDAFNYLVEMRTLQKERKKDMDRLKAAYRTAGWNGVLIDQIKMAEAEVSRDYFQLGCLYAKTGDKDKAFDNLEKSYQERSHLIAMLNVDPELRSLHDDPRFANLIRRVEGK